MSTAFNANITAVLSRLSSTLSTTCLSIKNCIQGVVIQLPLMKPRTWKNPEPDQKKAKITRGNQRRNNCMIWTPNRTVSISSDHYFRLYVAFFEKKADIQRKGRFSQTRRHHWWRWRRQADLMLGYSVVGWHPLRRWNNTWLSASFSWNPAAWVNEISLYSWLNSFPDDFLQQSRAFT